MPLPPPLPLLLVLLVAAIDRQLQAVVC